MATSPENDALFSALTALKAVLSPEKCEQWLMAVLHGGRPPACPKCGHVQTGKPARTLAAGTRVRCQKCERNYNQWSNTIIEGSHITPEEFVFLRVALATGIDHKGLARLTGRGPQAIRQWTAKIREFEKDRSQ